MLEPICFSLSDEVGHYEVIESLTEIVGPSGPTPSTLTLTPCTLLSNYVYVYTT
jgi:hypothetical protein